MDRICAGIEVVLEGRCQHELHIFLQTLRTMVGSYMFLAHTSAHHVVCRCFGINSDFPAVW